MDIETLEKVIQGCIQNDRKSQELLYKTYYNFAESIVCYYVKDHRNVEEIVHNGFLNIFKKITQYEGKSSFTTWIRKIFFHESCTYNKRYEKYKLEDEEISELETEPILQEDRSTYKEILNIVRVLSEKARQVFELYLDGYTHKEISKKLDISEGTSKWYIHDSRRILQPLIKSYLAV